MSELPLSNVGSTDAEAIDSSIQRMWDRYATSERSANRVVRATNEAGIVHLNDSAT